LNDLGSALEINQLDGKPVFLEETFFLSDVGLGKLSGDKACDTESREFRARSRIGA
jgi:hypothetical protein